MYRTFLKKIGCHGLFLIYLLMLIKCTKKREHLFYLVQLFLTIPTVKVSVIIQVEFFFFSLNKR